MSGGLTPCRQLRPSSRREHVKASKSYMEWKKKQKEKQATHKSLKRESQIEAKSSLIKALLPSMFQCAPPQTPVGGLRNCRIIKKKKERKNCHGRSNNAMASACPP